MTVTYHASTDIMSDAVESHAEIDTGDSDAALDWRMRLITARQTVILLMDMMSVDCEVTLSTDALAGLWELLDNVEGVFREALDRL